MEAGTWKGGGSIFARLVLKMYGQEKIRKSWVCDSFAGLPKATNAKDNDWWYQQVALRVRKERVRKNFEAFNLLDGNVEFVKGYFVYSLPKIRPRVKEISVLWADGDMYESTMDILFNLYDKVAVGGFIIMDDYDVPVCKEATDLFRSMHNIKDRLHLFSYRRQYWRKSRQVKLKSKWYSKFVASRNLTRLVGI